MQAGTFEYANGVIGPDTVTALGIVTGCQRYNRMAFTITGLTTETISVNVSFDYDPSGSGTWSAAAVRPIDMATGALTAASTLTNGTFLLVNTPWRAIRFDKTATADTATVRWGILNAN